MDWFLYDIGLRHESLKTLSTGLKIVRLDFCYYDCTRTEGKLVNPFRHNALRYFDPLW